MELRGLRSTFPLTTDRRWTRLPDIDRRHSTHRCYNANTLRQTCYVEFVRRLITRLVVNLARNCRLLPNNSRSRMVVGWHLKLDPDASETKCEQTTNEQLASMSANATASTACFASSEFDFTSIYSRLQIKPVERNSKAIQKCSTGPSISRNTQRSSQTQKSVSRIRMSFVCLCETFSLRLRTAWCDSCRWILKPIL